MASSESQAARLPLQSARYQSGCSLFEKTMRIKNRLGGFSSLQTVEQFHETRFVRIAHGRFPIWLDPFGMLDPEVIVNLLPKLSVSVDLMRKGHWLGERFRCGVRRLI